jgi:hypothetical protein
MFVYTTMHCSLKAHCAILVRCSNFHHQASPRESTQQRKVKLWTKNVREFCLNADLHVTFRDLLQVIKLRHGTDGFTCPPEKRRAEDFFGLKIRRLWPGVNPQTWVPKASTLPRDHQSRLPWQCRLFKVRTMPKPSIPISYRTQKVAQKGKVLEHFKNLEKLQPFWNQGMRLLIL